MGMFLTHVRAEGRQIEREREREMGKEREASLEFQHALWTTFSSQFVVVIKNLSVDWKIIILLLLRFATIFISLT